MNGFTMTDEERERKRLQELLAKVNRFRRGEAKDGEMLTSWEFREASAFEDLLQAESLLLDLDVARAAGGDVMDCNDREKLIRLARLLLKASEVPRGQLRQCYLSVREVMP